MLNRRAPHRSLERPDPFSAEPAWRPLQLIVDLERSEATAASAFLRRFGVSRTAGVFVAGPDGQARVELSAPCGPGDPRTDYIPADLIHGDRRQTLPIPGASSIHARAAILAAAHERDHGAVERLLALNHLARSSNDVDAFISDDPLTAALPAEFVHVRSVAEGVALLGLALRAKGDFTVERANGNGTYLNDETFYRAAAMELLQDLDGAYRGAGGAWRAGRVRPYELLQGTVVRLARALRARDYLHVRMRALDFESAWGDVLFFLDAFLVALVGALDTTARFVHDLYQLPDDDLHRAGWRRKQWLKEVVAVEPRLAVYTDGGAFSPALELIARLRNQVHEAPFSEELQLTDDGPGWSSIGEGALALPRDDKRSDLLDFANATGGAERWGIRDRPLLDMVILDPSVFVERAIRTTATLISNALERVDLSRLGTPDDAPIERFQTRNPRPQHRPAALLLAGLGPDGLPIERTTH